MFRFALSSAMFAAASLLAIAPAAAPAAASLTMPTCAAGDAVVWENTKSKVFHLSSDKYYGKTKNGAYACESAAVAAGFHAAGSKSKGGTAPASGAATATDAPDASPSATAAPTGRHHHHRHGSATPSPAPVPAAT